MKYDSTWINWRKVIIADRDLHFYSKGLALYLATFMNDSHDMAFPSLRRIEHEMSLSRKTIIKYLGELEEIGYLQKGKILNPKTTQFHNTYTALIPDLKNPLVGGGGGTPPKGEVVDLREEGGGSQGIKVVDDVHPNNQRNNQRNSQDITYAAHMCGKPSAIPPCPYAEILDLYHKILPMCPAVIKLTDARKASIRARWRADGDNLKFWEDYFTAVSESRFLTGRTDPANGRSRPFVADIDFLIKPSTLVKVQEGKYHG
jgi:hypothetical protein